MNARVVWFSLLLVSCAFGGGDGYHSDGLPPDDDPVVDAGGADEEDAGRGTGMRVDASSGQSSGRADASAASDASEVQSDSGPVASIDAGATAGANSCMPSPALAMCDPVKNTGCPPINVCSLDSKGSAQAGLCQLTTIGLGSCADGNSTLCDAKTACVERKCVPTCYCDTDCTDGKKCTGTVPGAAGPVKLCQ